MLGDAILSRKAEERTRSSVGLVLFRGYSNTKGIGQSFPVLRCVIHWYPPKRKFKKVKTQEYKDKIRLLTYRQKLISSIVSLALMVASGTMLFDCSCTVKKRTQKGQKVVKKGLQKKQEKKGKN